MTRILRFTGIAYLFTYTILVIALMRYRAHSGPGAFQAAVPWIVLASFGPFVSAVICAYIDGGRAAVGRLLRKLIAFRAAWPAYGLALLAPLVVGIVGATATVASGHVASPGPAQAATYLAAALVATLPGLIGGPLGEELGWRGYLLPIAHERFGAWGASLLIAPVWALWHGPAFLIPEWRGGIGLDIFVPVYLVSLVGLSCLMTAVWLRSRHSVVPAMLCHSVHNSAQGALVVLGITPAIAQRFSVGLGATIAVALLVVGIGALVSTSRE